jgi:uncharacterized membrane protein
VNRALGFFFIGAGLLHFVRPRIYEATVPDRLPAHRHLVYASGAAEMVGGAAAMVPATRRAARWWLIATLAAVFPANVHMAVHADRYGRFPAWALWARLPFQSVFVAWVWRATATTARSSHRRT